MNIDGSLLSGTFVGLCYQSVTVVVVYCQEHCWVSIPRDSVGFLL